MHQLNEKKRQLHYLVLATGIIAGFLLITQITSFKDVEKIARDTNANNVFREVQTLKLTNDELKLEIEELTTQLSELSDGHSYRESIRKELNKNEIIAGLTKVQGPGVTMTIDQKIGVSWLVDISNELWTAGAQAIAINGIRLSPYTIGFEEFNEHIYINKVILNPPYKVEVVGNAEILEKVLTQQGSITARLTSTYDKIEISVEPTDTITMDRVR